MSVLALSDHVLNFALPALFMAAAAVLCGGLFAPARGMAWPRRLACHLGLGLAVLLLGLLWWGDDGRMATWGLLLASVAMAECLLRGAWRA